MSGLNAALFALRARDLDGQGQLIDLSMQEVALSIAPETGVPLFLDDMFHRTRSGNRRILARPWGHYRCLDGFVSTLVLQPTHWINAAQWISEETGNDMFTEEAFRDLTVRAEINDLIDEWFEMVTVTKTKLEVFAEGQRRGVPVTPLNTIADLLSDPHLEATGFFDFAEHPVLGTYKRPGAPFRVNHSWWSLGRAPLLGEHTAEVLAEWG